MKVYSGKQYLDEVGLFVNPTQVIFRLEGEEAVLGGIAYNDKVICGCCGQAINLSEVDLLCCLPWVDIEGEIRGDMYSLILEKEDENNG